MSDGETVEEAIQNGKDTVRCWLDAAKKAKRAIPTPGDLKKQSGKWVQRVPKSMLKKLKKKVLV